MDESSLYVHISNMIRVLKAMDNTNDFISDFMSRFGFEILLRSEGKSDLELARKRMIVFLDACVKDDIGQMVGVL